MKFIKSCLRYASAILTLIVLILSTCLCFIPILFLGLLKLWPQARWRIYCTGMIDRIVTTWCGINGRYIDLSQNIEWQIIGLDELNLKSKDLHLVIANHQSWVDILILQKLFNKKIPTLKFFLKDQLKWIPLLGFAWWAMGLPFMKRHSKEYLAKNPHKKGQDLESIKKAVNTFGQLPSSIMNFVEGSRFSSKKKALQASPYEHLLKPKAGGLGFIIQAMGYKVKNLIDVTIIYAGKQISFWDFLCHRIDKVTVQFTEIPIPPQFFNETLLSNDSLQEEFRNWINVRWQEKDKLIKTFLTQG